MPNALDLFAGQKQREAGQLAASLVPLLDGALQDGGIAKGGEASPLRECVFDVLALGPEEEVLWPDTSSVIATMTHIHTGGDRTMGQFPCDTMGVAACSLGVVADCSVPVGLHAAGPVPAAVASRNLRPESLRQRLRFRSGLHILHYTINVT